LEESLRSERTWARKKINIKYFSPNMVPTQETI
jgi:hypothetical protein